MLTGSSAHTLNIENVFFPPTNGGGRSKKQPVMTAWDSFLHVCIVMGGSICFGCEDIDPVLASCGVWTLSLLLLLWL